MNANKSSIKTEQDLKTVVDFAKRKGFVFQSSEIYGGFAAVYDFGQLGMLLKKNIEQVWRYWNVSSRTDMVEIEGAIIMHPKVWEASGHTSEFADLLVEDTVTHKRYRADHLIEDAKIMDNAGSLSPEQIDEIILKHNLKSPDGNPFTSAKKFNLLVKTHLGSTEDDSSLTYLKGESCQNIYLNFKQVQETSRKKIPFGIAQIGKAFRNEITTKQFLFRTREFEQMDVQYFYDPENKTHNGEDLYEYWKNYRLDFYTQALGFDPENLRFRHHEDDEQVFYVTDAFDIEYKFGKLGFKEIEGLHDRGTYDLDQHSKFSGQDLRYQDPLNQERKYNPPIIECSAGFNRIFLATIFEFLEEELLIDLNQNEEKRIVFRLPYNLAPFKLAVLPLMKKDGLSEKAFEVFQNLRINGLSCDFDETGSIGKRYRRQDEIGTPWCVCVDYDTLGNGDLSLKDTVTLRNRDTMEQERVKISDLNNHFLQEKFK